MRLCASLSRGVAAPLGCVILFLLSKLWLVCPALRVFPRVRDMGGITTLGVLYVLLKRRTAACQNGSFAVFRFWPGMLSKNAESLRDSDALMRVAVPRRRGPAGLRDPVSALLIM